MKSKRDMDSIDSLVDSLLPESRPALQDGVIRELDLALSGCAKEAVRLEEARRLIDERLRELKEQVTKLSEMRAMAVGDGQVATAATIRAIAREILEDYQRPMGRAELVDAMTKRGLRFEFHRPEKAVGKIMWAAKEFCHLKNGYWIAGVPLTEMAPRKRFKARKGNGE